MQNDPSGDADSHGGVSGSKRKVDIVSCASLERVPLIQLKLSRAGVWPVTPPAQLSGSVSALLEGLLWVTEAHEAPQTPHTSWCSLCGSFP